MESLRILAVEAVSEAGDALIAGIRGLGHDVETVRDAREAGGAMGERQYDAYFVDLELPADSGFELLSRLSATAPLSVSVATTTRSDQDVAVRALECGAHSFLRKPLPPDDLSLRMTKVAWKLRKLRGVRVLVADLISDRSTLRHKVAERERFLGHLIDAAPFAVVSTDGDGNILTFNGQAEKIYGYRESEVLGNRPTFFGPSPANAEPVSRVTHSRKDGTAVPVVVRRRKITNDVGTHVADLHVIEDLTEREQMQNQLLYAERLSVLGQLAPRIAHELKAPLQIINGAAELSLETLARGDLETMEKWLRRIPESVESISRIVNQMTNLGKPTERESVLLDIGVEFDKVMATLEPMGIVKYCKILRDYQSDLPQITGDPGELEHLIRNLVINAVHAMESTPEQVLSISAVALDPSWVELRVKDTGCGIPEDTLAVIFEPFYTTKPEGKGTGLGLPIVKSITDRFGGKVSVRSTEGKGTEFVVRLPTAS